MAKKKKEPEEQGMPAWLITFGDMMTLLLTFFVLLVSMSVIDERRRLVVLGSIIGTFGIGTQSFDVLSAKDTKKTVEPGPMDEGDLEMLKEMLWDNAEEDLRFESNKFVQILSVNADLLFDSGRTTLSPGGVGFLDKVLPVLKEVTYPLLLAGHTSTLRDELGENYSIKDEDVIPDLSWKISLGRVLSVYAFLLERGFNPDMLKMEAFGKFHPRYNDLTPEGRRMNRRVDIVLDKRSVAERRDLDRELETMAPRPEEFDYNGFVFSLNRTGGPPDDGAMGPDVINVE